MKIEISSIVEAFAPAGIGTRVTQGSRFLELLEAVCATHDFSVEDKNRGICRGQAKVDLPAEALATLISGVGRHTHEAKDYVPRKYRGRVGLFLRRAHAAPATGAAAIVYTAEAYLSDPQVAVDKKESARIAESKCSHVLVAVLAFAGPPAAVGVERFVANLAGGNSAYAPGATSVEALQKLAKEVLEYHETWCTVSD